MKSLFTILFLVNISLGFCQDGPSSVSIVRVKLDSNYIKKIRVINTGFGNIIVFPAEDTIKHEELYLDSLKDEVAYFDPDSSTILQMNADIKNQYCDALRYQVHESYISNLSLFGEDTTELFGRKSFVNWLKIVNEQCICKINALDSMYKQVIAVNSKRLNGDVLFIQLIDFRDDPYKLKERSKVQMIDGFHGWFETNIETFYYHIKQRKLSVHGENFKSDSR